MSIIQAIRAQDPVHCISEEELDRAFLVFCSYMCVLHNKKLNLANIFLLLLKSENIKNIYLGASTLINDKIDMDWAIRNISIHLNGIDYYYDETKNKTKNKNIYKVSKLFFVFNSIKKNYKQDLKKYFSQGSMGKIYSSNKIKRMECRCLLYSWWSDDNKGF